MASAYFVEVFGGCLGLGIPDGARLSVDPTAEISPGDCIKLTFKPGDIWSRWLTEVGETDAIGGVNGAVKIYCGRVAGVGDDDFVVVGQLWPPVVSLVPVAEIAAMHRVNGIVKGTGKGGIVMEYEQAAWDLVKHFCNGVKSPPI